MTFNDIFKSSFLENITNVSVIDIILSMLISFALGIFIFLIYKKTYKGVMYSGSFAVTLIALSMITTLVILAVTSNVVLSLGMVGALSIVRFRTAIKEPLDIAFLFWSIAIGIVVAAGMIPLAVFGSIFIGLFMLIFVNRQSHDNPYILIVQCNNESTEAVINDGLSHSVKRHIIKSKTVSDNLIELNYEVRLATPDTSFVNAISAQDGVINAVLVSYNGDYMG